MNSSTFPKFVAFDAFGTLVHGNSKYGPYGILRDQLKLDRARFRDAAMKGALPIRSIALSVAGRTLSDEELGFIDAAEEKLREEVKSIRCFPETPTVLAALKSKGINYGIVSNLSAPYGEPLLSAIGELAPKVSVLSYEVGAIKPERGIYDEFCRRMGCSPQEVLFVGDRVENDLRAPIQFGFHALLVNRGKIDLKSIEADPLLRDRVITDLTGIFSHLKIFPSLKEREPVIPRPVHELRP